MISQAVMIISGYNSRAVIAFCRWATKNSVNFHIIARNEKDPILLTSYKHHLSITRNSSGLHYDQIRTWTDTLCRRHGYERILILPSTEYLNRFLLENRTSIESENCVIPLVNEKLYRTISDKHSFSKLCALYGLDIPVEYDEAPKCLPFVAKPRSYFSSGGGQLIPHLIQNTSELEAFRKSEDESDYFFQEFVFGRSLYLLAHIPRDVESNTSIFSQENLIQQAKGGSIILARRSSFHETEVARRYVEMLHDQNFFGLIMIEVRFDPYRNRYYMIEANPRLWGPIQFCIDNNVDLFGGMLRDHGIKTPKTQHSFTPTEHYFWSGGTSEDSHPEAYYNYTPSDFAIDYDKLRRQDIFARKDTIELYLKESE
ncbi:hypothetical protein [uncultured Gilvimarinus sp.]|uniref:hypothetical protein n=1 Tax=uncultured Gilvimarinus sp. TaxID=1689143 RepID=UPI0030DB3E54